MTIQHNKLIDRIAELGFNKAYTFTVTNHLAVHNHIWIVNDKTDRHAFAVRDITVKELQDSQLWPQ